MRLDEAFAELGVSPGTPPDALKRAYLKLVKQRPPETDPEGFQRARAAFELARRFAGARVVAVPKVAPISPPETERRAPPSPDAPPDSKADRPPPAEAEPEQPLPARPAPSQPSPFTTVRVVKPPPPAAREVDLRFEGTREMLRRAAFREAAPLIEADLKEAAREGRPPVIEAWTIARTVLELIMDRAPAAASRVSRELARYVEVAGGDVKVFGANATIWILASELSGVGKAVPLDLRVAMAGAALGGSPNAAAEELDDFETEDPVEAARVAAVLRERAPVLAAMYGRILDPPERVAGRSPRPVPHRYTAPSRRTLPPGAWIAITMALSVLGRAATCESTRSYDPPRMEPVAPALVVPRLGDPDAEEIRRALNSGECRKARSLLAGFDPTEQRAVVLGGLAAVCVEKP